MNRIAITLAILAIVTAIGGVLCLTTTSVAGTAAYAIIWGLWGISLTISLISAGIAIARR